MVDSVPDRHYPDDPQRPDAPVRIHYNLYVPKGVTPSAPAPAILAGHHGGGPADPGNPDRSSLDLTLNALLDAGFVVQTWAARGYAPSGGTGRFNSPEFEVKDVQALLDKLATVPEVLKDGPGDPRVGMVGESYGAWIQLLTATRDPRIDALNPRWTPYDIGQDLEPNGVLRSGWTATLDAALSAVARFADELHTTFREGLRDGKLTDRGRQFLADRSAKTTIGQIKVPTLLVQSVSDTLTRANNAIDIYRNLGDRGVPTKLYLFCGGHTQVLLVGNPVGISCNPTPSESRVPPLVVNWMEAHLRGGGSRLGPPVQFELQDGSLHTASHLPSAASSNVLEAQLKGLLVRTGDPYEGPTVVATASPDGVRTDIPAPDGSVLLGVPHVTMTVTRLDAGTDTTADIAGNSCTQVYVFSKLIDKDATGRLLVIDEQATPMCFSVRAGESEKKSFDLAAVAWKIVDGHTLFYEVSATSTDFAAARQASTSEVEARVKVPVVALAAA